MCAVHQGAAAEFICGRCGTFACAECAFSKGTALCRACAAQGLPKPIPWERRKELGRWRAFWQTTQLVMLSPGAFFRTPSVEHGIGGPLLYSTIAYAAGYVTLMLLIALLYLFMGAVAGIATEQAEMAGVFVGQALCIALTSVLWVPVSGLLNILMGGGLTHVTLLIFRNADAKFEQTIRAVAYANAACIWYAIPCFGFVGWFWMIVGEVVGVREAHRISTGRAALAVLGYRAIFTGGILLIYGVMIAIVLMAAPQRGGGF